MPLDFRTLPADPSWSFSECTSKQTRYITHGYYTYPAKFIPQLAARLIRELSSADDLVADPFMGSGTTIVEALVQARRAVGVDINPVAQLVTRVKSTPIAPDTLAREFTALARDLAANPADARALIPANARIDYWFPAQQKARLGILLARISEITDAACRDLFCVAFAQILKSCSIWLQRSVKPTRDPHKTPAEPFAAFLRQARAMLRQNEAFWNLVPPPVRADLARYRIVECADARTLPVADGAVSLIVTSPPYVTSYEYADLHQLTALWFAYLDALPAFRQRFIGSAYATRAPRALQSETAERIGAQLGDGKKAREVRNYFADMLECFAEMRRVLRVGGKACLVIGNTKLRRVEILNAEVFVEQMHTLGFRTHTIIQRAIPSKILPQTRDPASGRFTPTANSDKVLAYPVEYILVMEKT